jgi:hypothetical protein
MRVIVVFKDQTDYSHEVFDYLNDFKRQTGHELETLDPDTAGGTHFCNTYDIVEYPSVIAISDDGTMQNLWRGLPLPTISEVSGYVQ